MYVLNQEWTVNFKWLHLPEYLELSLEISLSERPTLLLFFGKHLGSFAKLVCVVLEVVWLLVEAVIQEDTATWTLLFISPKSRFRTYISSYVESRYGSPTIHILVFMVLFRCHRREYHTGVEANYSVIGQSYAWFPQTKKRRKRSTS